MPDPSFAVDGIGIYGSTTTATEMLRRSRRWEDLRVRRRDAQWQVEVRGAAPAPQRPARCFLRQRGREPLRAESADPYLLHGRPAGGWKGPGFGIRGSDTVRVRLKPTERSTRNSGTARAIRFIQAPIGYSSTTWPWHSVRADRRSSARQAMGGQPGVIVVLRRQRRARHRLQRHRLLQRTPR
jgi:hypothetical protein